MQDDVIFAGTASGWGAEAAALGFVGHLQNLSRTRISAASVNPAGGISSAPPYKYHAFIAASCSVMILAARAALGCAEGRMTRGHGVGAGGLAASASAANSRVVALKRFRITFQPGRLLLGWLIAGSFWLAWASSLNLIPLNFG